MSYKLGFSYKLASTQIFTAANNFKLAIAVTVALTATFGPSIEVLVLLSLVYVVKPVTKRVNWKD
ncbi:SBF-domain-containing protein [Penicillium canescens]|nr:SBF-domain-containing protein [Penicillium canescens]